jgi:ATP/maltotriose-dependent transcriptional regulator MalT
MRVGESASTVSTLDRRAGHSSLLLERWEELTRIEAALAEARDGRGRLVVVEGPAGIGKTTLLAEARTAAAGAGMQVLSARATELERDFSFGIVRQLLEPVPVEAQAGAGAAAGLLGLPSVAPVDSHVDPSFVILHGLYWLCANLAAARPLCIVVDDAHWADAASLRFLAFLITRLEELDIALVVATRPCEEGVDPGLLAAVKSDPSADVIHLPPLTREAVAQLVESRLGEADRVFVDAVFRATRGTPFLVRELVEALSERGTPATPEAARQVERIGARTVGRSIRLRLRRLPEHARRLAQALAVLEQSDLLVAARLAGLDELEGADAAELLVTAGILEPGRPLRFIHPIVRSGLYAELTSAERAEGHRAAARLLAERPGASESVAEHLLATDPAADDWVVERLVAAARDAARNGAPESAVVYLRRVIVEPPTAAQQHGLLLELGTAEASAGLDGWVEHLKEAVALAPDAEASAAAAIVLGRALNRAQRFAEAVEVLDRAAAALDSTDSELALKLEAGAVVIGMSDPVTAPSMKSRGRALRERAAVDPSESPELLAVASFISILRNEPAEVGAALATRALSAGRGPGFSSALFARATLSLLWAERYDQVRPLLDGSIAESRTAGDSSGLAAGLANRAWLALRRGDLTAAEADARTALTELPSPPMYRVLNGGVLVGALVEQGELDEAERVIESLGAEVERRSITAAALRLARGRLRVEQGRIADGLDDFHAVGDLLTRASVTCPSYVPWRSDAALAALMLGERRGAERLALEELELARTFGTPRAVGVAARAAGLVAGGDRGAALLREAVHSFEQGEAPLERARALADLGALLRRRNHRVEARELLREALDAAHRSGAKRLAEYAETELRATGARPRRVVLTGVESLTASERRIAELAGQGLTNREIAQMLFVTARTVEGHLTSVFRKLQLDSRNSLPAALA